MTPLRRALVTAGVLAVLLALQQIPLPGLDPEKLTEWGRYGGIREGWRTGFSVGALGFGPWLSAFLLVELFSLLTPGLRARRVAGPEARAPLERAVTILWVLFCVSQSSTLAGLIVRAELAHSDHPRRYALLVCATLTGASALWGIGARLITSRGLGSGWALMLALLNARPTLTNLHLPLLFTDAQRTWLVWMVALLALVGYGTWRLLRAWTPEGLPLLSAGFTPLTVLWFGSLVKNVEMAPWVRVAILLLVCVVLAGVYSRLFNLPGNVAPALGISRSAAVEAVKRTLPVAYISTIVASGITLIGLGGYLGASIIDVFALAQLFAVGWDLHTEWRARGTHGALTPVRSYQKVYAVQPALRLLEQAGIPVLPRSLRFRQVTQFFGPYAPIDLLVPVPRAAEARDVLTRLPTAALPDPPAPSTATSWGGPWFTPGGGR